MRILLVEDDPMVGAAVRKGMQQDGHSVDWVVDASAAAAALAAGAHELALLDLGLPGKSGLALLGELRRAGNAVPIIICTARDAVADRVRGLDLGADDYLVKPFALDELAARIRAVMRRRYGQAGGRLEVGPLRLDPASHEVELDGTPVTLSAREFAILEALMERPRGVLSRAQIEERLYGWDEEVASNAVEVHIHNLRRKLGDGVIRTVRGLGYSLGRDDS
ncbi:MAG: response regulator [Gammaproteobacteria bacterium]